MARAACWGALAGLLLWTSLPAAALGQEFVRANAPDRIVVTAPEIEDQDYAAQDATTATKADISLRDTPQTIDIVTRQVLADRAVLRLEEAADNVPGVEGVNRNGGTDTPYYTIRGFGSAGSTLLRDGFRDFSGYLAGGYDPIGIERVEFLKGPASILYGNVGSLGGAVNLISKRPTGSAFSEAALTLGSFDLYRATLDSGGPIGRDSPVLYRLTAAVEDTGSFRDFVHSQSVFVAPALTWNLGRETELTALLQYQHIDLDWDNGFPAVVQALRLPVDRNLGVPGFDHGDYDSGSATLELEHHFNDAWRLRSAFNTRQANADERQEYVDYLSGTFLASDGRTLSQTALQGSSQEHDYAWENELSGVFETGPIKHNVLFGFELARFEYDFDFDVAALPTIDIDRPIIRPIPTQFQPGYFYDTGNDNAGLYYQDLLELLPNLKLLHGGRFDWARTSSSNVPYPGAPEQHDAATNFAYSPRVALIYQPWTATSLYADWSNSFTPQVFALTSGGRAIPPETGEQYELGARQTFLQGRLQTNLSLYQLTRQNVLTPNPANPFVSIPSGEQRSRGLEFSAVGSPGRGWQVIAAYAYTDARVTDDSRADVVGNRLIGAPLNSGSLWGAYTVPSGPWQGLGFGVGVYLVGGREATLPNSFIVPAYYRLDAEVSYRRGRYRWQLNCKNLTDRKYFDPNDQTFTIQPGSPLTALGTFAVGF